MKVNEQFYRALEVDYLQGDYSKINSTLGWKPETSIDQIIEKMVSFDLKNFNNNVFTYNLYVFSKLIKLI